MTNTWNNFHFTVYLELSKCSVLRSKLKKKSRKSIFIWRQYCRRIAYSGHWQHTLMISSFLPADEISLYLQNLSSFKAISTRFEIATLWISRCCNEQKLRLVCANLFCLDKFLFGLFKGALVVPLNNHAAVFPALSIIDTWSSHNSSTVSVNISLLHQTCDSNLFHRKSAEFYWSLKLLKAHLHL